MGTIWWPGFAKLSWVRQPQMGLVLATRSNFCIRSNNTHLLSQRFALGLSTIKMQSFDTISLHKYAPKLLDIILEVTGCVGKTRTLKTTIQRWLFKLTIIQENNSESMSYGRGSEIHFAFHLILVLQGHFQRCVDTQLSVCAHRQCDQLGAFDFNGWS